MTETINTQKVKRIWEAEKELIDAINNARKDGIVVQIEVFKWPSGTETIGISVKQLIFHKSSD